DISEVYIVSPLGVNFHPLSLRQLPSQSIANNAKNVSSVAEVQLCATSRQVYFLDWLLLLFWPVLPLSRAQVQSQKGATRPRRRSTSAFRPAAAVRAASSRRSARPRTRS